MRIGPYLRTGGSSRSFLNRHQIRFLSLDTGVAHDVSIDDWPLLNGDWSADGKSVFMPSITSKDTPVILDVNEAGKAEVVLEGDANTIFWWFLQSPDGRYGMLEADGPRRQQCLDGQKLLSRPALAQIGGVQ